ncbi:HAMP domain-containing sensor histidine kinase [Paraflavitalea sp. CAU 1676]|uniref:sensor histidine kinase n=1 Tax=Paraflavitalea sp. CAU 1676 TaxID=3032598 RepID=UPI0023D9E57E|nr:HAMP domain-containing sensor histidine kinase [Paraflavitalea sp. CAU 1676]MDF2190560.1 HAMP domain-containing sensor histidine kinase [Paraflavitalea sp. CAU 1676]
MIRPLLNWRTGLAIIAIAIVSGTIFYSQFLARRIAQEERQKVAQWVEAGKLLLNDTTGMSDKLVSIIISENRTIPIIETDEHNNITQYINLDSASIAQDTNYVKEKLKEFAKQNDPIGWADPRDSTRINNYYYGHTTLLNQVAYYPLVQLLIVSLFIIITLTALTTSFKSSQNQVWAGMAKETAHQLGTPLTSLQGWVEMMRDMPGNEKLVAEMEKDVGRLKLVSDRFGKIGSTPHLEQHNVVAQVGTMIEYIRKRAPGKVSFTLDTAGMDNIPAHISPPLFDWVIENLLKNALDAMEGKGSIAVQVKQQGEEVLIDVTDSGKGIARQNIHKVFKPGFTTKKRGWGLGLSLSRRIIVQYHKGQLFVKQSELNKGTTFRIVLKK